MRHAIRGERPGTTVQAAGRFVTTDPVDGGAAFSEAQLADLEKRGYELERVDDVSPAIQRELTEAEQRAELEAQNRLAVLNAESAANAEKAQRVPSKRDVKK